MEEEEAEYEFASFGPETDLYQQHTSSASSDAYSYFKYPSYFSVTQLTDLLSTSSKSTSIASKKSNDNTAKPKHELGPLRNGGESTAAAALPAPPHAPAAVHATAMPTAPTLRSHPSSGVSVRSSADSDDSVARLGRSFLAPDMRSHFSSATALSPLSSRRAPATAGGPEESVKPTSPFGSERLFFNMPNVYPSSHRSLQQQLTDRRTTTESNPQLPDVPSHRCAPRQHRNSAPALMSNLAPTQPGSGRAGHARSRVADDDRLNTQSAPAEVPAASAAGGGAATERASTPHAVGRPTDPRKPTEAAAPHHRPRVNASHKSSSSSRSDEDTAMTRAVSLDKEFGRITGSSPRIHFYDITHATSPSGASLKGESVVPMGPVMRTARIEWDDDDNDGEGGESDAESSPPALAYVSKAAKAALAEEEEDHVQIIIVTANADDKRPLAEVRPPPLDAEQTYPCTPLLSPVAPPPTSSVEPSRAVWHCPSTDDGDEAHNGFKADEVVDVNYVSGSAVHKSLLADALRIHFLSGHNTMLTVANTPQCTALAEDAVSTMIQAVFQQSELMGSDFNNELSITAHAIYPEGVGYNLLPMTTDPPTKVKLFIGANPVMGTCIVNNAPVRVTSMKEAVFLSRALIQNARELGVDPYSDPNAVVHITVLLRQTRAASRRECTNELKTSSTPRSTRSPHSSSAISVEASPLDMHVYLSSLQILWVGHNYPVVHHLLTNQPAHLWSLYRQAFGGQCCTAVMSFVDRKDDLTYSKSMLEFSQYMRSFFNRPPRSGSVQKFIDSTEQAANEELDRNILSLEKMRRDAIQLLKDAGAEPCLYAVTPPNRLSYPTFASAAEVSLIRPDAPAARKTTSSTRQRPPPSSATSHGAGAAFASSRSIVSEIQIHMPSFIKRHETTSGKGRAAVPPPTSAAARPSTRSANSRDAHVRSDRHVDRATSLDAPTSNGLHSGSNSNINTVASNDEPLSTASSYGECIKTNVLVVRGELEAHNYAGSATPSTPERVLSQLPLTIVDAHRLVLNVVPPGNRARRSDQDGRAVASHVFEVDEVHEAAFDHSTNNYRLLRDYATLRDVYHAFVAEETNVALLCTHQSATVRPFQSVAVWEVVEAMMTSVSNAQMRLPTPSQFTVFASVLKGNTVVRDLAEVGAKEAERPVDGQEALVGASPLFGSILYKTRGVDLFHVAEVKPVLHRMLEYADAETGADPDVYLVLIAVRKTTRPLPRAEAPDHSPEYLWDASFSSCTVVVTRNSMEVFQNAVEEMNTVVVPDHPIFPFGLLSEVIGGSCKTVHLLSIETANTPVAVATRALDTQHMLGQVQNEVQRSNRISVYVGACLTASRAINDGLDNLKQMIANGGEMAREITEDDELLARAHAAKLEALAAEHAKYLCDCDIRGFVIYPTPTIEDMQTLFFTSFRYANTHNSSGRLRQLQTTYSNATSTSANRHRASMSAASLSQTAARRPHPPPQQQQQQQHSSSVSEVVPVDPSDSLPASAKNAPVSDGDNTPHTAATARAVSAGALSRDSGIVAHTMLLLLQSNDVEQNSNSGSNNGGNNVRDGKDGGCWITLSPTNEVTVNYGSTESVYAFDDVVNLTTGGKATRVSPTRNYTSLNDSALLHDAVSGCLAGFNATLVFQETMHAQAKGVCESLCQHVCRSAVASCPPEAAFFLSVAYLDEHSAVDLLSKQAVEAAITTPGVEGREPPLLGKSPLVGTFLANAELQRVCASRDVAEALTGAFYADELLTGAGVPPHFIVISLWQKLYVSAEKDVCVSSLLMMLTRGGPRILQSSLASVSNNATVQLLNYALRGSCYTICGCAITDAEPQAATSANPLDADFEPAMDFYQNNLSAYTGKALRYNSVTDALKSHRAELERVQNRWYAYQQKLQSANGSADGVAGAEAGSALTAQERKDGDATEFAMRHLQRMIADEETLLRQGTEALSIVPPYYVVNGKH